MPIYKQACTRVQSSLTTTLSEAQAQPDFWKLACQEAVFPAVHQISCPESMYVCKISTAAAIAAGQPSSLICRIQLHHRN